MFGVVFLATMRRRRAVQNKVLRVGREVSHVEVRDLVWPLLLRHVEVGSRQPVPEPARPRVYLHEQGARLLAALKLYEVVRLLLPPEWGRPHFWAALHLLASMQIGAHLHPGGVPKCLRSLRGY